MIEAKSEVSRVQLDNEQLIVRKATLGDGAAFEQLMSAHEGRMFAVALRMCANREDALDCTQEAMLRIFRAMGSFKGQSSFATWVYRITMNTCLDELRRRKVRVSSSLDALLDSGFSPAGDIEDTPEHYAVASEQRRSLEKAIASLPEDMRAAIVLRDVQGFSYEEIADMLSANVGTIKSRISRGREKLREMLMRQPELFGRNPV